MVPHVCRRCTEVYQNPRFLYNAACGFLWRKAAPALILLTLALWTPACTTAPKPEAGPEPIGVAGDLHASLEHFHAEEKRRGTLPPLPGKGYILDKLADGVYFFSDRKANTLFVVSEQGVVLVDPLAGAGPLLQKAIREVTEVPVSNLVYTTAHPDHIRGAGRFGKVPVVAHRTTTEQLRKTPIKGVPLPRFSFNKNYILKTPGHTLRVSHTGGESGVTLLHLPEAGVLMVSDRAVPGWVPVVGPEDSVPKRMDDVKQMLRLNFHTYLAGHAYRPGERRELERLLDFYQAGRRALRVAVQRLLGTDAFEGDRFTLPLSQLKKHQQEIEGECVRLLQINWEDKLVGFRKIAPGHCQAWFREHAAEPKP